MCVCVCVCVRVCVLTHYMWVKADQLEQNSEFSYWREMCKPNKKIWKPGYLTG